MRFLISTLFSLVLLTSCGDSPFLEDENQRVQGVQGTDSLRGQLFISENIQVSPYWALGPSVATESKITFLLLDKNGAPLNEQKDIRVKLWMPTMGHGSFPVKVTFHGLGMYQATDVFFTMPGYWDIHFQIFEEGSLTQELKWPLNL